jgi:hypothetical protein
MSKNVVDLNKMEVTGNHSHVGLNICGVKDEVGSYLNHLESDNE